MSFRPDDFEIDEDFDLAPGPSHEAANDGRYTGQDTIDEPVLATLLRDIKVSGRLLKSTLLAWWGETNSASAQTHDWDLWGPMVFCLGMSLALSHLGPAEERAGAFSTVFSLVCFGLAAIALNVKLLGGTVSLMQALSLAGYALFPLTVTACVSLLLPLRIVRLAVACPMVLWAIYSAHRGLSLSGVEQRRLFLATYPIGLVYTALGWLCVIA